MSSFPFLEKILSQIQNNNFGENDSENILDLKKIRDLAHNLSKMKSK